LLRFFHPEGVTWGGNLRAYDPRAIENAVGVLGRAFGEHRYFRLEVTGLSDVPDPPVMFVGNHSGGTTVIDVVGFGVAWYRHFGTGRPIHPAAHEILMGNRYTGPLLSRLGVVRADRELARVLLTERREDLLVLPGGDVDVWRPYSARYEVRFAGRTGYARIALQANVPIVPVAHAGAHETLVVLSDGRRFAEAVGLPRIARAHVWPVHLSLPWGLAIGPLPHLPVPARFRYRLGAPIHPREVGDVVGEPTPEQVRAFDALVREALQRELNVLRDQSAASGLRPARSR
jgi:1-acyl-sn-glycerol-3-phosphate acyltransferase